MYATRANQLDPVEGLWAFIVAVIIGAVASVLIVVGFNITHEKHWQPPAPTPKVVILHAPDCGLIWPPGDIHWSVASGFHPCLVD